MKVGTLQQLWRYPVKSMAGESLEDVELTDNGLPGDRAWAVRDEVRGGIRGAKKIPGLMGFAARYADPPAPVGSSPAVITLPDGSPCATGAADVNQQLSDALDHEVSLWPLLPAEALDHYRRGAPGHEDMEAELREMFGRAPDEPLPNLGLFPPELMEFECPPGTYFDAFPLLLISEQALSSLQSRLPESRIDHRRFRPNLLVAAEDGDDPMLELAWRGRKLRIGEALVEVTVECPRCVMITHGFDDLPKDPGIMRALVKETEGIMGVYAKVEVPGAIRVGDALELA